MTVLFVADTHLCAERPDLVSAFSLFLDNKASKASTLYLLGDIFDAWIGDDFTCPYLHAVITSLKQLSQTGCTIYFQQGNRDFLVAEGFAKDVGMTLLPEKAVIELPNQESALIMHGDQLCTDDIEYQKFRTMVRDPNWQAGFLSKSLEERLAIAKHLREISKKEGQEKSSSITDVNDQAVIQVMQEYDTQLLIHGHTHRPMKHSVALNNGSGQRIVLGDWGDRLWYLECTTQGCELVDQTISAT